MASACALSSSITFIPPPSSVNHSAFYSKSTSFKTLSIYKSDLLVNSLNVNKNAFGSKTTVSLDRYGRKFEIFAISTNDFKVGTTIELDNAPWRVQEFMHVKPGKGAAFVRTKIKNYFTGNTVGKTFRAGESVDEATVTKEVKQYTYEDGNQLVFMDMVSFEELRLDKKVLGDKIKWLLEGMECNVLTWKDKVFDIDLPITVKMKVTQSEPGIKGDTAGGGATKPATVETGASLQVPLFVNEGDEIIIDTRTGTYMSRA